MPSPWEKEHVLPRSGARCLVADMGSDVGVVITHPWGPLGGNMHNNVVAASALFLQRLGVTTLRLNFAGSQLSRGNREVDQVVEAADFLLSGRYLPETTPEQAETSGTPRQQGKGGGGTNGDGDGDGDELVGDASDPASFYPDSDSHQDDTDAESRNDREEVATTVPSKQTPPRESKSSPKKTLTTAVKDARRSRPRVSVPSAILLIGYSYGSLIAASASAEVARCIGVVLIAPPVSVKHWLLLFNSGYHMARATKRPSLPRFLVQGSRDNFTSDQHFANAVAEFPEECTTGAVLRGADHFFRGREKDLMDVLGQWLIRAYSSNLGGRANTVGDLTKIGTADFSSLAMKMETALKARERSADDAASTIMRDLYDCAVLDPPCRTTN